MQSNPISFGLGRGLVPTPIQRHNKHKESEGHQNQTPIISQVLGFPKMLREFATFGKEVDPAKKKSCMSFNLAQINVARMDGSNLDDPIMKEFVGNIDRMNSLAERSPGFIWRWIEDSDDQADLGIYSSPEILLNISVWKNMEALKAFTYSSAHSTFVKRRKAWFKPYGKMHAALWWIHQGVQPGPAEAIERLEHLQDKGASPYAFTFGKPFSKPMLT